MPIVRRVSEERFVKKAMAKGLSYEASEALYDYYDDFSEQMEGRILPFDSNIFDEWAEYNSVDDFNAEDDRDFDTWEEVRDEDVYVITLKGDNAVVEIDTTWGMLSPVPRGFDEWDKKDEEGRTMFEVIVSEHRLPPWFNDLNLWNYVINDDGETCEEAYERIKGHGYVPRHNQLHGKTQKGS